MVSRVKSLSGLIILRDFALSKIRKRQSEDFRNESKRIAILRLLTLVKYGTEKERQHAEADLKVLSTVIPPGDILADEECNTKERAGTELNRIQIVVNKLGARPEKRPFTESKQPDSSKRVRMDALDQLADRRKSRMEVARARGRKGVRTKKAKR